MSYRINSRRLKKIVSRLRNLPGGAGFFKYSFNKLTGFCLKITRSTKVSFPSSIMLEMTNHCNLACITCPREYAYGDARAKGTMERESRYRVVEGVAPMSIPSV